MAIEMGSMHHRYGAHDGNLLFHCPHAQRVQAVVHGHFAEMEKIDGGNWKIHLDPLKTPGTPYKLNVQMDHGGWAIHTDPFAIEVAGEDAKVASPFAHEWTDAGWMEFRKEQAGKPKPVNIMEVYPGRGKGWKNWRDLAHEYVAEAKEKGFTHVSIMGALAHTTEGSLGYQIDRPFAPTGCNGIGGNLPDFQYLVNHAHNEGIGVFVDWTPHFDKHDWGLHHLGVFEKGETDWDTHFYDFENPFVVDYLISSVMSLLENHVDGIRIDHVEGVLKCPGGHAFLNKLNEVVHPRFPGALTMAEDPSASPDMYSCSYKWNMGAVHDVLDFMQTPHDERGAKVNKLIRAFYDTFRNPGILALSHDISNPYEMMAGLNAWEKWANERLLLGILSGMPAKKEHFIENDNNKELIKALNHLYKNDASLWGTDGRLSDLEMLHTDTDNAVFAYKRGNKIFIHNCTPSTFDSYDIKTSHNLGHLKVILNSDDKHFGGTGDFPNERIHTNDHHFTMALPPCATVILEST